MLNQALRGDAPLINKIDAESRSAGQSLFRNIIMESGVKAHFSKKSLLEHLTILDWSKAELYSG
jgi:hypothetical protein